MCNLAAVLLRAEVCESLSSSLVGDCCDQHSSYRLLFKRGVTLYCSSRIERLRIYPASRCDSALLLQHVASPHEQDLTNLQTAAGQRVNAPQRPILADI